MWVGWAARRVYLSLGGGSALEEERAPEKACGAWMGASLEHPHCAQCPPERLHSQSFKPHDRLVTLEPFRSPLC